MFIFLFVSLDLIRQEALTETETDEMNEILANTTVEKETVQNKSGKKKKKKKNNYTYNYLIFDIKKIYYMTLML